MRKNKYSFKPMVLKEKPAAGFMDIGKVRSINANILDQANGRDQRNIKRDLKNWQHEILMIDGYFD